MFRYRLHSPDGDDLGEATYAVMIKPDEEILVGNGRRFRVSSTSSRSLGLWPLAVALAPVPVLTTQSP